MSAQRTLRALFDEFLAEMERNATFRAKVESILGDCKNAPATSLKPPARRKPGRFDPMALFRDQPGSLNQRLEELDIEELKDIIAGHGMDRTKLAMKWKDKRRLIALIVTAVESRSQKGDAFRAPPAE